MTGLALEMAATAARMAPASPRLQASMAGVIAWIITTSGFATLVSGGLVVPDDPVATAHSLLTHEAQFRLAVAGTST